ncbi:hypothetical protein BIW11_12790 [Tropilaelaps mercedesae]|uniref:Uncharacterized protein n=1 Tax=Tropilaelaps mercedesae TaxID=418985 RepID=A0A1V9X5I3_9ACAR|nr:hypothetical protein BIW11_12790 [Tropilaelaps mercedesae]
MATFGCATATMKFFASLVTGNGGTGGRNSVQATSKGRVSLSAENRLKADRAKKEPSGIIWTQQPKDGRATYKARGSARRLERTISEENIARNNHINLTTSQNHLRSIASQSE